MSARLEADTTRVRDAEASERKRLSEVLGRAFEDDPVMAFVFPEASERVRRTASFYRAVASDMVRHGRMHTEPEFRGAAVWQAPKPPRPSTWQAFWTGLRMVSVLRGALPRIQELGAVMQEHHPKEPHWYLAILGTDPVYQGQGVGSLLIAPTLAECDRDGLPAYLESSKEQNIPFYERHGFRVSGEIQVPSGPTLWAMWREPRGDR